MKKEKIELTDENMNIIEPGLRDIFHLLMKKQECTLSASLCITWTYLNYLLMEAGITNPEWEIQDFMDKTNFEQNKRMMERDSE